MDRLLSDQIETITFTGYIIEKFLSVDNIFIIALIFGYFRAPLIYQYRVFFWGVVGALLFRAIMIALGSVLRFLNLKGDY